ncbi:MAG: SprB repeat-containing protein [Cyclobacteriaceae bacterium]|nr:SprB repeat-containing protein [Cyclobacteriaceae bacterium HetDA_MAG_MS6]
MQRISFLTILAFLVLSRCASDSEDDLKPDCSEAGPKLSVASTVDPTCTTPGSVTLSVEGGVEPFSFQVEDGVPQSSQTFEGLPNGSFTFVVEDDNGCTSNTTIVLAGDDAIGVVLGVSGGCSADDGVITATASGGDGAYEYSLNGGAFGTSSQFDGLGAGTYEVAVRDGNGCSTTSIRAKIGVSLNDDIVPIINANCALSGCHLNARSPLLTSNAQIINFSDRIKSRTSAGTMPPSGSLPADQVQLIASWVDCGSQDN